MRAKTLIIIVTTFLLTLFLAFNTDAVEFNFLVSTVHISKLIVVGVCLLIGFILGFIVGTPKRKYIEEHEELPEKNNDLSDEDKQYIS